MRRLDGLSATVTGAAGGIGSLVAARLREAGAHVTGVDRVPCPACDDSIPADLSSQAGVAELSGALAARRVDLLVNIAGMQYFGPLERQDAASIWLGYAVNLIAPTALIRAVLPQMQRRRDGQIVNIGSVMGSINYPFFSAYSGSKAGLKGLSEGLRREVGGLGVHVTYVAPRAVRTAFNDDQVNRFMALARMKADEPAIVADRILRAILRREKDVSIGLRERMFSRLNAILPRLIDAGLSLQTRKARGLFTSTVD